MADDLEPILASLAGSMGLAPRRAVAVREETAADVRAMILDVMRRQYPGDRLDHMSRAFERIALVPEKTDLREEALLLYEGQIAGYYDPYAQRLVLLRGGDEARRRLVLHHELAHALQDQHFELAALIDRAHDDEDRALALQAVLEGQAVVAMFADPTQVAEGVEQAQLEALVHDGVPSQGDAKARAQISASERLSSILRSSHAAGSAAGSLDHRSASSGGTPADSGVPPRGSRYLREQLVFPYREGTRFIEALLAQMSLAEVVKMTLSRPPESTAEVLHPDRYLAGERSPPVPLDAVRAVPGFGVLYETSIGELNVRTIVGDVDIAAGWRADRLLHLAGEAREATVWLTAWASEAAAERFFAAYRPLLSERAHVSRRGEWVSVVSATNEEPALVEALRRSAG